MDVLRPPTVWINGICYRKNTASVATHIYSDDTYAGDDQYKEREQEDIYADESCDIFSEIEETDNGWKHVMQVPSALFKFIIGKKAETKKRLENETRTQIRIPKQGEEGDIVIVGRDRQGVSSARSRIHILVESARHKQPFTHFLSLPVTNANIKESFLRFKDDVLHACDLDRGLDASIFQNPHKLHLTLGTLVLLTKQEVEMATSILRECQQLLVEPLLSNQSLDTEIRGLEYMNDDPNAVDVLYAQIHDPSGQLQTLSEQLIDRFSMSGLLKREYDRVKLHITVLNTVMRRDAAGSNMHSDGRESFDAANVLKNFGDYNFGAYRVNSVHLSQRYSTGPDGYYACEAALDLPTN